MARFRACKGNIGIMEKKMETIIMGYIGFRVLGSQGVQKMVALAPDRVTC